MTKDSYPGPRILRRQDFDALLRRLSRGGHALIGPTERDGAVMYGEIGTVSDLPVGRRDQQSAGHYRLHTRGDEALFGYAVGPDSLKRYLHPPRRTLWRAKRTDGTFEVTPQPIAPPRYAFLGVRACELAALERLDSVFLTGAYVDPFYRAARESALVIAVNCAAPAATCFCPSMETGPQATSGFDLALTELLDADGHRFLVEVGSPAGAAIADDVPLSPATQGDLDAAAAVLRASEAEMTRKLDTDGLAERLASHPDDPRWSDVASRCLSCGNCTQVCPTCFCNSVEDATSLSGDEATRTQVWDSCFTGGFSELSGGMVRETTASRYRQWMTHKLSTWIDQFGTSGCVGCGRCIAWCPVGIDLTVEATAIGTPARETER